MNVYSGRWAGDVGGGTDEANESSEQHRREDRQVSLFLSWLSLMLFYSST